MYYVKYENAFTCQKITWDSGEGYMVKQTFFLFAYRFNTENYQLGQNRKVNAIS